MIKLNKEYFRKPYYFYLKDKGDKILVYFSVSDTLSESRQNDQFIEIDKSVFEEIQNIITKILKSNKKLTKQQVHKLIDSQSKKQTTPKELDELVNPDGSMISSNIPILNQRNLAKKTMDQTVRMTKSNQFPFIRVYYGESEENKGNILDEVDQSESFGFEETEFAKNYNQANKIMINTLKVKDNIQRDKRLKRLGFDKKLDKELQQDKKRGKCKNCFTKRRLSELEKEKMEILIDEILLSKKTKHSDVVKNKTSEIDTSKPISKILMRNIEAIKKIAEKENISVDSLVKHLKKSEQ